MAVPVPRTWVAGETETATIFNGDVRDTFNFQLAPPRCFAYRTTDESLTNATWEVLNFDTELYDSHGAHSGVTNTARLTAPESGLYSVTLQVRFAANSTNSRQAQVRVNDTSSNGTGGTRVALVSVQAASGGDVTTIGHTFDTQLSATDWIVLDAQQNSGGALNAVSGPGETFLSFRWVAKTA
jgi:hypothetical protein